MPKALSCVGPDGENRKMLSAYFLSTEYVVDRYNTGSGGTARERPEKDALRFLFFKFI